MGAKLQALRDLQNIELQIVDIQRQCHRIERRVAAQQRKIAKLNKEADARRDDMQRNQIRFDQLDTDIKGRQTNIERLREHLNTVRTNKEYAAMLAQINNEKADTSKIEAQALEIMQAIEAARQELAEHDKKVAAEQERLAELQQELEQTRATFAGRLEKLEASKRQALEAIDPPIATLFKRVAQRYDGEVMAEVHRPNPRRDEFVCGGCHMQIRVDTANALKVHDEVRTCKNCGRILYIEKNT